MDSVQSKKRLTVVLIIIGILGLLALFIYLLNKGALHPGGNNNVTGSESQDKPKPLTQEEIQEALQDINAKDPNASPQLLSEEQIQEMLTEIKSNGADGSESASVSSPLDQNSPEAVPLSQEEINQALQR